MTWSDFVFKEFIEIMKFKSRIQRQMFYYKKMIFQLNNDVTTVVEDELWTG